MTMSLFEIDPVTYFDESYLTKALDKLMSEITKHTDSNILLALHGHDASFPHKETPALIRALNSLSDDTVFIHSSLTDYAAKIREVVQNRKVNVVLEGEMRHVNQSQPWNDAHLYPGVLSTKGRLKRRNREVENILIRHAEPAASLSLMAGEAYETEILEAAWKIVLANHAHDTINACSLDAVYHDAMHRFKQAEDLSRQVVKRSLARIVKNIDLSKHPDDRVFATVFNLSPHKRSGIARVVIDMPHDMQGNSISITDPNGSSVDVQLIHSKAHTLHVDKTGFGKTHHARRVEAWAYFHDLPAAGYTCYLVEPSHENNKTNEGLAHENTMENEYLMVVIEDDGSLTVYDKQTGAGFEGLNTFIDEGELGNAWTPGRIPAQEIVQTRGRLAEITLLENGPVKSTFRVVNRLELPVSSAEDYQKRSGTLREVNISSFITLQKGLKQIHVLTEFENTIHDHRLRVLFPSGIQSDRYYASMPFDVTDRPIPKQADPAWVEPVEPSDPNTGFIGIENGKTGLAIANIGLYEGEVMNDQQRTIALTLLRCFYQHGNWSKDRWPDEEFQNPGHHTFTYAICPYGGTWSEADIHGQQAQLDNPLKVVQHGKGKPGNLPLSQAFLHLPDGLKLSCIKKAEIDNDLIIRIYNPGPEEIEGDIAWAFPIHQAWLTDMEENELVPLITGDQTIRVVVPHHKITTIKLRTKRI
jgi:mannosylglycerate hydrolase